MWVDRRAYDRLLSEHDELVRLRGENSVLVAQVSSLKAQIDSAHAILNLSNADRSLLMQRVLGMHVPAALFSRVDAPADAPQASAPDLSSLPDRSLPVPSAAGGEAVLDELKDVFADMGDDRAKHEGLVHAETGEVIDAGSRD